jgi:hypothetical protein
VTGGPDGKLTCWKKNKAHTLKAETPEATGAEFSLHVKDLRAMKVIARDETDMMICAQDAPGNPLFSNQAVKQWRIVTAGGAPHQVRACLDLSQKQCRV